MRWPSSWLVGLVCLSTQANTQASAWKRVKPRTIIKGHGNLIILFTPMPKQVAEELRSRVHEETGLTCSAGVAPSRLLAKVLLYVLSTATKL
ncbi:hypothetical protein DITRI_Ditri01bG0074300 [Diplodiscus trichospermus]